MNDTQTNQRQNNLLNFIFLHPFSSRAEIEISLEGEKSSRITIIRDLNRLLELGWIEQNGGGKHIKYSLRKGKELLIPINLESYFKQSTDQRNVLYPTFDMSLIKKLGNLFLKEEIDLFEQGRIKLEDRFKNLDKTIVRRELERFTVELSWKSSQIEGNTYSLLETEELIKNQKEAPGHDKSEAVMIINHKNAFDVILNNKETFRDISLSDIRSIHAELTKDLEISSGIRESAVGITGTKYIPLDNKFQIEEAIEAILSQIQDIPTIPEKALILLSMIAYLQPFTDGNKRTSRLVSNAVLLANGYYPLSYRSVDEVEYKKALILFYEQHNIFHLKRIFLEQQKFAIDHYFL